MNLPDEIRQTVAPAHVAVEQTPFAQAMVAGRLSRTEYADGLNELAHLHQGLEAELEQAATQSTTVAAIYQPGRMSRAPLLERDLAFFGRTPSVQPGPVVSRLICRFRELAITQPIALLGPLYITEGSRMGSMMLARSLGKAFGLQPVSGGGLDYHADGIATRPQDWKQFREALANLPLTDSDRAAIVAAAVETMDGLVELYGSLPVSTHALGTSPAPPVAPVEAITV